MNGAHATCHDPAGQTRLDGVTSAARWPRKRLEHLLLMKPESVLTFAAVAAVVTITPGIDTALIVRTAVDLGRRPAFFTATGICCGLFIWGSASGLGLSTLVTSAPVAYTAVRLAGAALLILLGTRSLLGAWHGGFTAPDSKPRRSSGTAYGTGLLTNLLNPKIGLFYLAALPQFIPRGAAAFPSTMLLVTVHAIEGITWLTAVAWTVDRISAPIQAPVMRRWMQAVTGSVLVALAIRVIIISS
jgi:threonine/homoserine/homoserine lactone efflux protein